MHGLILTLPAYGHVNCSLGLAKELALTGHQISAYTTPLFQPLYEANHTLVFIWPLELQELEISTHRYIQLTGQLMDYAIQTYGDLKQLHEKQQFDYLVVDFLCVWGKALALEMKIPCVHISPTIIMDRSVIGLNWREILSHFYRGITSLIHLSRFIRLKAKFQNLSNTRWNGWDSLYEQRPGTLSLLFIPRSLQPQSSKIQDDHYFLGPSLAGRTESVNIPSEWFNEHPLVLVALGSIFNKRMRFYRKCAQAIQDQPYQMILSTGKHVDQIMEKLPTNVLAFKSVPQLFLLEKAQVFITHGGANSIVEAIWYEVPIIVIPEMGDHFWMAKQVEKLKIGIWIRNRLSLTSTKLRQKINEVANNQTFRKNLKSLKQECIDGGGSAQGAEEIIQWAFRTIENKGEN